jgi:acyl-CoA synthetase (AMP-forming)/AMP-acid ligase II
MPSFTTLLDACVRHASDQPGELAFRLLGDGERETGELTFEQLLERAVSVARFLVGQTAPGDRVLLLFHPGLDLVAALYGCFLAGRVAVPCYPPRPKRKVLVDLRAIAEDAGAQLALSHGMLAAQLPVWLREQLEWSGLRVITTDELAVSAASLAGLPSVRPEDVAFLQYTSGSTGAPKGVVVTHGNVIANLEMIREMFGQGERSSGVIWLPPYHDMGLIGGILQPVFLGRPVTLMPPTAFIQKPVRWLRAISETRATTSGGPNFAYDLCVDRIDEDELTGLDLSSWQVAFNGAEPVRLPTLERFAARFARCGFRRSAFLPCYGMAETTLLVSGVAVEQEPAAAPLPGEPTVASAGDERAARTAVSCGRPAPRTEVRVVDPESRRPLGEDEVGELWVASPSVARGYWGNPARTEEIFGATLATDASTDASAAPRYLRTGDLGFLRGGEVFVTGRIKDLLIIRGKNFYPQDVEAAATAAHPALVPGHAAAFSVERDGEEQVALVLEVDREHLRALDEPAAAAVVAAVRREAAEQLALSLDTVALVDRKSTRLNSSHNPASRMPSSA